MPVVDGVVTDATRIRRIVPTIREILAAGGKHILLAHFERPGGERLMNLSLKQLIPTLGAALGAPVLFAADCVGSEAELTAENLRPGQVLLLENSPFHATETKNDPELAIGMAKLGEVYCNDVLSTVHRSHSSVEAIARLLPACAGRLMQTELEALEDALGEPKRLSRPFSAVQRSQPGWSCRAI